MTRRKALSAQDATDAARVLRSLLTMVRHGEMDAPSGTVHALTGALAALEAVTARKDAGR